MFETVGLMLFQKVWKVYIYPKLVKCVDSTSTLLDDKILDEVNEIVMDYSSLLIKNKKIK